MRRILTLTVLLAACQSSWTLDDLDGDGVTLLEGDCDDLNADVSPERAEVCDGVDNNCDGAVDDESAEASTTWYADEDGDGFGNPERSVVQCEAPEGFVEQAGDCDDASELAGPNQPEICDGLDNDCDDDIDEEPTDGTVYYEDRDLDGFGSPDRPVLACSQPGGTTTEDVATDCEDDERRAYPGSRETEVPGDGIDQDCDGVDACTDFTCDGLPDVVVGTYREDGGTETEVRVFPGQEDRRFATVATERLPSDTVLDLASHDLNADGYPDLVWISGDAEGEGAVSVAFGGADGLNPDRRDGLVAYRPRQLEVVDLDGDGDLDLVVASSREAGRYATTSYVYVNDGAGSFTPTPLTTVGAEALVVEDLDDDGWIDVAFCGRRTDLPVRSFDASTLIYWSGIGGADYSPTRASAFDTTGCEDLGVGDWDGDGLLDLYVAQGRDQDGGPASTSLIVLNDEARFVSPTLLELPVEAASRVAIGDLDGDGADDVVFGYGANITESWSSTASVFLAANGEAAASETLAGVDPRNPSLGDIDGDGDLDVLVPSFGANYGSIQEEPTRTWLNDYDDSGGLLVGPVLPTDGAWNVSAVDADEDGRVDLFTSNAGEGDSRGAVAAIWYRRDGGYAEADRWAIRMGKIRALPVIVGTWPDNTAPPE